MFAEKGLEAVPTQHHTEYQCLQNVCVIMLLLLVMLRKRERVQKSMGHKVPYKTEMLIYNPVTPRFLILLQEEAASSPCNFATAHVTAFDPEVLQSGSGLILFCFGLANLGKLPANCVAEFSPQVFVQPSFSRASAPQKKSPPKFTPKIVGMPPQSQIFEPFFFTPIVCLRGRSALAS